MDKRTFIKVTSIAAAGSLILPMTSCSSDPKANEVVDASKGLVAPFELPQLAFEFDALAPNIDAQTMEIHHGKHHAGYVKKLNAALEGNDKFTGKTLEQMLASVGDDDTAVRNNGGGHYNHSLFWETMTPKTTELQGDLASLINGAFGSFDNFKTEFSEAATSRFGSGWAWLSLDTGNKPVITSTPNQDNPLMKGLMGKSSYPLLGLDVWEHAYYLNYQNRRGDYVSNFFNVINWDAVAERFMAFTKG